jgi:alpha-tubulin suppressor-like RCC1 family protein
MFVEDENLPLPTRDDAYVTSVACGREHTLCISSEGLLFSCGSGYYGQLGLGHRKSVDSMEEVHIPEEMGSCVSASGGDLHSAVLMSNGRVYTFGLILCFVLVLFCLGLILCSCGVALPCLVLRSLV